MGEGRVGAFVPSVDPKGFALNKTPITKRRSLAVIMAVLIQPIPYQALFKQKTNTVLV
jgi:hypothetical protein